MNKKLQFKSLILLVALLLGGVNSAWATTVNKTMNEIVTANSYTVSSGSDATCYKSFSLDDNITISTTGEDNCGSFWGSSTKDWRLYQNKNGNIIISAADNYTLNSITITYSITNTGTLKDGDTTIKSGEAQTISGSSKTYTVGNTNNATNGQVRVTAISVTYSKEGESTKENATLSISSTTIFVGKTANVTTNGPAITLTTSDSNKATVSGSTITGVSAGSVEITATWPEGTVGGTIYASDSQVFTVTVEENNAVTIDEQGNYIFDFTKNYWDIPTDYTQDEISYTSPDYTVKLKGTETSGEGYKFKDNYLLFGKKNASLTLPAFTFDVSKIIITGNDGASTNTKQNIFVGETAVSKETTSAQGTNTYEIASDHQQAGTVYTIKVTNSYNTQITKIEVYKKTEDFVSAPTISPTEGGYTSSQSVTLTCSTDGATIYYTIDGTEPSTSSSIYSSPISINSTTTIKAIAVKGSKTSSVVSATYTIVSLAHAGTETDPYTVADARNAIDAKIGTTEVYATGIVSEIVTSYSSEHKNITFNISADGLQAGNQLQAFRCEKATDADVDVSDVRVGDIVIIYGNLKKFNTTYEFDQGNNLVSLTRPVVSKITVAPTNVEATEFQKSGILEVTYQNCEANSPSVKFYNAEGTTEVSCDWIQVTINEDNNFDYIINANQGDARTAYLKICNNGVYSNLVTVTQSAAAAPATLPFSWAGGIKTDLEAMTGVLTVDAGTNYAESNAPYRVKFDNSNRNILIKTDSQPGIVTVGVKMLGGNKTSSIIVQESANGSTFENVDELSISGSQNDIVNLVTTKLCQPTTRYIKLCFNKGEGSNVGVGPITITKTTIPVTISAAGWATLYTGCALNFEGTGLTAYTATLEGTTVTLNSVSSVPAGTGVVLKGAPQNYEIPVVGSSESAKGDLKGSTSEDIEATGKYILVQNGSNVEFAKATSGTIKAGKAYLEKTSSARILNVVLAGETTGIKSIETVQESNKVYNLNGQRVAAPQKGLYILNGKKVIIK